MHILDSQSGKRLALDDDSRYAMASTFKVPLVAALLWQVDHGAFPLTHDIAISTRAIWWRIRPIIQKAVEQGGSE